MRIAFLTDLHVCDSRLDGHGGQRAALVDLALTLDAYAPDLILVGGDLAGLQVPHRATPRERNALVSLLVDLGNVAPVVAVRGNHDFPGDYAFLNHLRSKHPVVYAEAGPEILDVPGAVVVALPWLDRTAVAKLDPDYGAGVRTVYRDAMAQVADDLRAARKAGSVVVVLAHAAVAGGAIRDGQPPVPTADPVVYLHELLDEGTVDAAFFGHYHARQILDAPVDALYGGAVFAHEYGEDLGDRGALIYDTETGKVEHVPVLQQPKILVEIDAGDRRLLAVRPDGLITVHGPDAAGPWAQVAPGPTPTAKLVVHHDDGDGPALAWADAVRTRLGEVGCTQVLVERRPRRTTRARDGADDIAAATTTADKVQGYMARVDPAPAKATLAAALAVLTDLESVMDGDAA